MYDLRNLNDYEFEILCKDIMEEKLDKELRFFKRGKDGGIDIVDFNIKTIIQVKHYINSKYANLKASLKEELEKVKKLKPEEYYICSGLALSKTNICEIYELFKDYMDNIENIMDATLINQFLEKESSIDIVNKHYKLWLSASNVFSLLNNQNVFIDCDELVSEIEKDYKFYVETDAYSEAKKILYKEKVIIIQGSPGVGKTTLSKMLLFHFVNEGYSVRYSTENNISDIKTVLSKDPDKKEIILLDDFLGQHYLKIRDNQPNEIKTLISFVKRRSNKKLIMNSRITILNEARNANIHFKNLIEGENIRLFLLDLDELTYFEKAKIFYNHIYNNEIPKEYFVDIKKDQNYLKIVKHKNYNPRIIEYVTKPRQYSKIEPSKYFSYVNDNLNNPNEVWEDEFINRITKIDRIFMNTLYSLTNNYINSNILEICFNKRLKNESDVDSTINHYKKVLFRLSDSLIKIVDDGGISKIGVLNPSINDYMLSIMKDNVNEQLNVLKSAIFIEQFEKMVPNNRKEEIYTKIVYDGSFLRLDAITYSIFFHYLKCIVEFKLMNKKLEHDVKISIERCYEKMDNYNAIKDYSGLITKIFCEECIDFYGLNTIIFDDLKMHFITKKMNLDELINLTDTIIKKYQDTEDEADNLNNFIENVKHEIMSKIEDNLYETYQEKLYDIISDNINSIDPDYISSYLEGRNYRLEGIIKGFVRDLLGDDLNEYIEECNPLLEINSGCFNKSKILDQLDYDSTLTLYFEPSFDDYDDDRYRKGSLGRSDQDEIKEIFER